MPSRNQRPGITFQDALLLAEQVGDEHGIRVRISIVPLSGKNRQQRHALLVTPYAANGRKLAEPSAEQLLWPSAAHKTFEGALVYLLHRLDAALDEWEATKLRDLSTLPEGALSPLEEYIAGYSVS